jgi:hypothetical protein
MGGGVFTWHILSVGIWTGAVATKAVVRKLVTDEKTEEVKTVAAKIDMWSGLLTEIPATVGVIITGWKLLKGRGSEKALMIMSTLGLTALTFTYSSLSNAYGRYQSALQKDWKKFDSYDKWCYSLGDGALHTLLISLGLGLYISFN